MKKYVLHRRERINLHFNYRAWILISPFPNREYSILESLTSLLFVQLHVAIFQRRRNDGEMKRLAC